jgi:hypothetical protein
LIADGKSLRSACAKLGLDTPSTHRLIQADPASVTAYDAAKDLRNELGGEEALDIRDQMKSGEIAPDVGRAMLDAIKWAYARMSPKHWGDRVAHEHTGKDGGPIQTESKLDVEGLTVEQKRALASIPVLGR